MTLAIVALVGALAGFAVCLFVFAIERKPKPRFCNVLFNEPGDKQGDGHYCRRIVAPYCVSGLCRHHCAEWECGCIKESGL